MQIYFNRNVFLYFVLDVSQIKAIHIKKICYVWCDDQGKFQKLVGLDRGLTTSQLHTYKGYSMQEQFIRYYNILVPLKLSQLYFNFKFQKILISENLFMEKIKSMCLRKMY